MEVVNAVGRRKTAVARVYLNEGKGNITINKKSLEEYFTLPTLQYIVKQPLELLGVLGQYDIKVNLVGGGFNGQAEALRLGIARALALNPDFIVLDEPVSALDVSIQAQVLNLMEELQQRFGLTYLFISHDLSVVKHISDQIAVMYLGQIVETASSKELFARPLHPYTQALLSAVPIPSIDYQQERIVLEGDVPSPINPGKGCRFAGRCRYCQEKCRQEAPVLKDQGNGHMAACHFIGK